MRQRLVAALSLICILCLVLMASPVTVLGQTTDTPTATVTHTPTPTATIAPNLTISSNLISCWDLEELTGTRFDVVGPNHLTDENTVGRARGIYHYGALITAGTWETLSHVSNSTLQVGNVSWAMAGWFYPSDTPTVEWRLISRWANQNDGEYDIAITTSNTVKVTVTNSSSGVYNSTESTAVSLNAWHLFTVWFDLDINALYLSVDDGEYTSIQPIYPIESGSNPLRLGFDVLSGGGIIDSFMYWKNRTLTETERTYLWNGCFGRNCDEVMTQPTPTPNVRSDIVLSSGNHMALDRTVSYGDIAIVIVGLVLLALVIVYLFMRVPNLWRR